MFKAYKNLSSIFFLLLTSVNAPGQINPDEMNGIHLDHTIKQAEKKLKRKLKLEKTKDGYGGYNLKASVLYKGIAYQLVLMALENESDLGYYNLNEISIRSNKIKTDLGIHVGSTLKEVQDAYKIYKNKPGLSVQQAQETPDPEDTTVAYYLIYDSEGGHLLKFSFTNNRVSEIGIASVDSL